MIIIYAVSAVYQLESYETGDYITVYSVPHSVDYQMLCTKLDLNLNQPSSDILSLGTTISTLTETLLQSTSQNEDIIETVNTINKNYVTNETVTEVKNLIQYNTALIEEIASEIRHEVATEYVTNEQLEASQETVISQTSSDIEFLRTTVNGDISDVIDNVTTNQTILEKHIRFNGAEIQLGRSDSNIMAVLDNDDLSFKQNGQKVSYISDQKLYITDAEVETLSMGTKYKWIIQSNDNLALVLG